MLREADRMDTKGGLDPGGVGRTNLGVKGGRTASVSSKDRQDATNGSFDNI